jgi:hypothetical protein
MNSGESWLITTGLPFLYPIFVHVATGFRSINFVRQKKLLVLFGFPLFDQ